jgi:hypothetical protein
MYNINIFGYSRYMYHLQNKMNTFLSLLFWITTMILQLYLKTLQEVHCPNSIMMRIYERLYLLAIGISRHKNRLLLYTKNLGLLCDEVCTPGRRQGHLGGDP